VLARTRWDRSLAQQNDVKDQFVCHDQPSVGALLASSDFPAFLIALLASKQWHTLFC
jgi:hypothetical protein